MRELEFRAWSKELGLMSKIFSLRFTLLTFELTKDEPIGSIVGSLSNEIVMQYTGLKDKNGSKIFEGDIVRLNGTKKGGSYISSVIYKHQSYTLLVNKTYFNNDSCLKTGVEVIGNIHENKLLGDA